MNDLDIYEVERNYYLSYWYSLPHDELMKTTPSEGLTIWKDIKTGEQICGTKVENIMGTAATQYYIFTFMDDERLGEAKTTQYVYLNNEEYLDLLRKLAKISSGEAVEDKND